MLTRRIIPCLDVKAGRTVKGVQFESLQDAGDAVELGAFYAQAGADELVYLDITATLEQRNTFTALVTRVADTLNIPFTVGGGIGTVADFYRLLDAGADKVSINSAALKQPDLIDEAARIFGSQCVVLALDVRYEAGEWWVYSKGGTEKTNRKALDWAQEGFNRGAGEILLTAMNNDGMQNGFALDIIKAVATAVNIPVIASGGAGKPEHFEAVFKTANADAALAASIFHFGTVKINDLKQYLAKAGLPIRLSPQ